MEAVMAWSGMMLGPKPTKGDRGTSRKHGYIMDYIIIISGSIS